MVKKKKKTGKGDTGVGAGGDAGDTGRNRVTADVSHCYFYLAALLYLSRFISTDQKPA